jgi:hypothetical protein
MRLLLESCSLYVPGPLFFTTYTDGKAQAIALTDHFVISATCKLVNGASVCGEPTFKLTDSLTQQEIKILRHKGLTWDALKSQISLHP